ncbi:hypothetical protein [Cupriavidus pauculus]|uniref:Uncharacterized protein n=1 Tax=Cupriavidus pauculus TaxID=82633 RepID=A0A2N5CH59_9BURK|nr:hypothetical protein [Cupriavidus pauculus]PLQ01527.1 hypothetical protein CYJ10_07585 [Cupriavidus pauculus]
MRAGYVACECAAIVFALALAWWLAGPSPKVDPALGHALLAATAAVMVTLCAVFEFHELGKRWEWPDSALSALILGLLLGLLALWLGRQHDIIAGTAIAAVCARLLIVMYQTGLSATLIPALAGACMGYWGFLLSYVDGYKTLWIDQAIQSGTVHVDLLFQSAVANMLSNYGVGSLGVDGLQPFPYHFGSHRAMIVMYELLGLDPLRFYSVVFPLIFVPVFVCVMFFFANALRTWLLQTDAAKNDWRNQNPGWFWAGLSVFFIGVIPIAERRELGVWDNVFHSESFGVAMLFAYFGGIWILEQLRKYGQIRTTFLTALALGLYIYALCMLKISVGLVFGCAVGYALLRSRIGLVQRLFGLLAVAVPLLLGLWLTRSNGEGGESGHGLMAMIKPFAFLRAIVTPDAYWLSFVAFFGPFVTFVALRLLNERWKWPSDLSSRFRDHRLMDVELAIVITIAAVIPGILLDVPQGSTNFFAEVAYWWVQPLLAVLLSRLPLQVSARSSMVRRK